MKKIVLVLLALFIAVPMVSDAGSVTSRWDMTIGGYVKFDVGYMSQGQGVDYRVAQRASRPGNAQNIADEYPALNWYGGETRLNFAVKGPDAWGSAKTSVFVEGDFRGVAGAGATASIRNTQLNAAEIAALGLTPAQGATLNAALARSAVSTANRSTGYFTLRHAFMTFAWPNTKLILGHTWQPWGLLPAFNILSFSANHFNKGATRVPQIRITQNFTKEFSAQFALAATNQTLWGWNGGNYIDDTNRALMPDISLEFKYATDKCGKIGPWMMQFGLAGMWGKEKTTYQQTNLNNWADDTIDRWGATFFTYIPIIPEKKAGKANALGFHLSATMGQGLGAMLPAYPGAPYNRPGDAGFSSALAYNMVDANYPSTVAGWAQLQYYWTNSFSSNALWGYQSNHLSRQYENANPSAVRNLQNFIFNIMYDVNPAIRFGLEYARITTAYGGFTATGMPKGHQDAVRFGAYYFF